jgi:hypothetical protein
MKKEYTDEATFITEEVEINDDINNIITQIYENFDNHGIRPKQIELIPIMVCKDKKSLCFGVNLGEDRVERGIGTRLYKVTVSKMK